jgi:hypothetical protein
MRILWTTALVVALVGSAGCDRSQNENAFGSTPEATKSGPAAGAKRFVNNPNNKFSADMREKYVDFAFDYPAEWQEKIDASQSNFVQVLAPPVKEIPPMVVAVGNASAFGPPEQRRQLLQTLLPQFEQQFGSQDFKVAWRGERQIGRYETMSIGFTGRVPGNGETLNAAGRIDIIVPPQEERGVTLISVALDAAEPPAPDQIENLPAFRTIYDSLRIGRESR